MCVSEAASEILRYLTKHPFSQTTLDGIAEWWLLEQKIENQMTVVKKALSELLAKGYVLENRRGEWMVSYRLNQRKLEEIQQLLKNSVDHNGPPE
jgi:hypothetical protein